MINTSATGNHTTAAVLSALLSRGHVVLLPFGDGCRYDLAYDDNGKLVRVQCKTGRYQNGVVKFNTYSVNGGSKQHKGYTGSVDLYGVYCPLLEKTYLVPVDKVPDCSKGHLRIEPSKNNQQSGVLWAKDFQVL